MNPWALSHEKALALRILHLHPLQEFSLFPCRESEIYPLSLVDSVER